MDASRLDPSSAKQPRTSMDRSIRSDREKFEKVQEKVDKGEREGKFMPSAQAQLNRPSGRKLILCFDGTGNKFHGDESDSNILKIFRMLDRESDDQYHYYQRKSQSLSSNYDDVSINTNKPVLEPTLSLVH